MEFLSVLTGCLLLWGCLTNDAGQGVAGADVTGVAGVNLTLTCNVTQPENATILWTFDSQPLHPVLGYYTFKNNNATLILDNPLPKDSGIYQCSRGNDVHTTVVTIRREPKFESVLVPMSRFEGESAELICEASETRLPDVSWSKDGQSLLNSSDIEIVNTMVSFNGTLLVRSALTIASTQLKHNGTYECSARNPSKEITRHESLLVYVRPSPLSVSVADVYGFRATVAWSRLNDAGHAPFPHMVEVHVLLADVVHSNVTTHTSEWNSSILVSSLTKATTYTAKARELMSSSISGPWSIPIEFTTTDVAIGPVGSLQVRATTSSTSLQLDWLIPHELNPGATIQGYVMEYSFTDTKNTTVAHNRFINATGASIYSYVLGDLLSYTLYTVVVQGRTAQGLLGDPSSRTARTKEAVPEAVPVLHLVLVTSTSVKITWDSIPIQKQHGPILHYVLKQENPDGTKVEKIIPYTGDKSNVTLSKLIPNARYTVRVYAVNGAGDGQMAAVGFSTLEGVPSKPRNLSLDVISGYAVLVKWLAPEQPNGVLRQFEILWHRAAGQQVRRSVASGTGEQSVVGNVYSGQERKYTLDKLQPYSVYTVRVREKTSLHWGPYSAYHVVITPEANPSPVPNVTLLRRTPSSLTIRWNQPLRPNGMINEYEVRLLDASSRLIRTETVPAYKDNGTGIYIHRIENLAEDTVYFVKVQAFNSLPGEVGHKVSSRTLPTSSDGFPWLPFALGIVGALLLIGIALVMYLFFARKKSYQEVDRNADDVPLEAVVRSKVIPVAELRNYCMQNHSNSDHGFYTEYESSRIPNGAGTFKWEHSQESHNQMKNRYSNIVAYDHTRVPLKQIDGDPTSTYINASYIDGYKQPRKYIATQGPLPHTINDFWRMVWEQNSHVIVMLTRLIEDSRVKCEQYWPVKGTARYGDIVVTIIGTVELSDYIIRTFCVHSVTDPVEGKREVKQFHFATWPDHGVPAHPTAMVSFVRHVMSAVPDRPWPVVIHCSAGVGRTGTFIVIEANLCRIKEEHSVDVLGFVLHIRTQRNFMVQTEGQYIFIYDALLDAVICGHTEIAAQDICAKLRYLNQNDPATGESHVMAEFKRLESGTVSAEKQQASVAMLTENKNKNRFFNVLPFDKNRVRLTPSAASRGADYINASFIDGYQQRQSYIACQAPLPNTVTDFWQMVWEHDVSSIVMLTKLEEKQQEKCVQYWPKDEAEKFGRFHLEVVEERDYDGFVVKEIRISNTESGKSRLVKHFLFLGWPEYRAPSGGREMIELIGQVQRSQQNSGNGPILVHCSGGVGRTGAYIAMSISIERLKVEGNIDLFQTVRALRMQRPAMVQTIDQYCFCYLSLNDYMDSFDLYSNFK